MDRRLYSGDQPKAIISWDYPSRPDVTLDSIDFSVDFFCFPGQEQHIEKEDLIRIQEDEGVNYYAIIDTAILGEGPLRMRITAQLPDAHAAEGYRKFVDVVEVDQRELVEV